MVTPEYHIFLDVPAYASPARTVDFTNLPPTVSFVGSIEPFHNETVTYMKRLQESGVPVKFKVFEGAFHAFDIVCRKTSVAKEATAFLMEAFEYAVKHYFAEQP